MMTKKNELPLVSVCIPSYNCEKYIVETIDSIADQTYANIEIIVVDDKSVDRTWDVLQQYERSFVERSFGERKRLLRVTQNRENLGMAGNWNKCLSLCSGEYIRLLCSDDMLDIDLIRREVRILEHYPQVVLVTTDTQFIDINGVKKGKYRRYRKKGVVQGEEAVRFSFFTRDYLGAPLANLFRKSVYEELGGFDNTFSYIIDYDFFVKLYLSGEVYILHRALNCFRIREDSNTGQVLGGGEESAYVKEHRQMIKKYADRLHLKRWQVELSVLIRKIMIAAGNMYLKVVMVRG